MSVAIAASQMKAKLPTRVKVNRITYWLAYRRVQIEILFVGKEHLFHLIRRSTSQAVLPSCRWSSRWCLDYDNARRSTWKPARQTTVCDERRCTICNCSTRKYQYITPLLPWCLTITLANVDRFSKFFHQVIRKKILSDRPTPRSTVDSRRRLTNFNNVNMQSWNSLSNYCYRPKC